MGTEVVARAAFSTIRYAQCWEDADILLEGLDVQPGDVCLSIASAGDNALALLAQGASRVVALDINPAQLACVALRVAAYKNLTHAQLLGLMGSTDWDGSRLELYQKCKTDLSTAARSFWDNHEDLIQKGIGHAGKFEAYFQLFRRRIMPLIHSRQTIERLLSPKDTGQRQKFYAHTWDNRRWRLLFKVFFSRFVMGLLGRDPTFFKYVEGSVADRILQRTRYALTELDPSENPYLQWILLGRHDDVVPYALRPENFDKIRNNLERFEWRQQTVEDFLDESDNAAIDCFNLSDIFEYMSEDNYTALLKRLIKASRPGARLAYWNMLAPRTRPESLAACLCSKVQLAQSLFEQDKAFFYSRFVVEEVVRGD